VHPVQELRVVKTQADLHKTQTGKELTYDQYVNLLLSDASAYDAQFAPKTHFTARAPYRAVYSHDFTASNEDNDPGYDIDSALDVIQANGHSTRPPGTSMALTQLSQDAKDIWDKLTDEANGIILDRHRDSTRPPGRGSPRPPFRNTNLHDLSSPILANIHDIRTESEGDVDNSPETRSSVSFTLANNTTPASADTPSTTLLANATQHKKVSPADLCRVLSSTMTRYPATDTTPKKSTDAEIGDVNGKKYRSVNVTVRSDLASQEHLLIEAPMVVSLEMTYASSSKLVDMLTFEASTIIRLLTYLSSLVEVSFSPNEDQ
jgi:hypothetical protein